MDRVQQTEIIYNRAPRFVGRTKWNYWRLWNLALGGIASFTIAPLKLATYSGLLTALMAVFYGIFIVTRTMILGRGLPGLCVFNGGYPFPVRRTTDRDGNHWRIRRRNLRRIQGSSPILVGSGLCRTGHSRRELSHVADLVSRDFPPTLGNAYQRHPR
jgi:hypothetical protein